MRDLVRHLRLLTVVGALALIGACTGRRETRAVMPRPTEPAVTQLDTAWWSVLQTVPDTIAPPWNHPTWSLRAMAVPSPAPDTIAHRVLLIGDSEAGGLMYAVNDYCAANGHSLVAVFTWFSATILNFAYAPRVEELIRTYRPTLIIIVVGLNEIFAGDLARRRAAAAAFHAKLAGIEYLWVGPANFAPDRGINAIFEETADPGRFFPSKDLPLPRASDDRHPSGRGYRIWMDSIASFMRRSDRYPFPMTPPTGGQRRFTGKLIMANAAKDRGY